MEKDIKRRNIKDGTEEREKKMNERYRVKSRLGCTYEEKWTKVSENELRANVVWFVTRRRPNILFIYYLFFTDYKSLSLYFKFENGFLAIIPRCYYPITFQKSIFY